MDFRLKVFISVAENLSFTEASKQLQISQPAITKHIQELEGSLGVKLFSRGGRKIELSAEGELVLKHAYAITNAYQQMKGDIALLMTPCSGEIRVGVCNGVLAEVGGNLLPKFVERFPQVELDILSGREEFIEKAVAEGRVDFAFMEDGHIAGQPGKEIPQLDALILFARLLYGKL